jgi:uncharacterized protein YecT (DUF1311 family)
MTKAPPLVDASQQISLQCRKVELAHCGVRFTLLIGSSAEKAMRTFLFVVCGAWALLGAHASAAVPGAINCAKAKSADEKTVCGSYELGQLDAQLATQYGLLKGFLAMGGRGALMDDQRAWLTQRAACKANAACLRHVYATRIETLQAGLDRVKTFGPF